MIIAIKNQNVSQIQSLIKEFRDSRERYTVTSEKFKEDSGKYEILEEIRETKEEMYHKAVALSDCLLLTEASQEYDIIDRENTNTSEFYISSFDLSYLKTCIKEARKYKNLQSDALIIDDDYFRTVEKLNFYNNMISEKIDEILQMNEEV